MHNVMSPLRNFFFLLGFSLLSFGIVFGMSPSSILAQEVEEEEEESLFNNEAQAYKADALAAAVAEANAEAIEDANTALEEAESDLADAIASGDAAAIAEAEAALEDAQFSADEALADASSVSVEDIAQMREDGMGWGEIAHELGVHPSTLGLGHAKKAERLAAGTSLAALGVNTTGRNFNNGKAKTPGVTGSGNGKALGLSKTSVKAKKAANENAQAKANGSTGSSKGGNGKGKGKGGNNGGNNGGGNGKGKGNS